MENGLLDDHLIDDGQEQDFEHVGFWPRAGASLLDFLVYLPVVGLLFLNMYFLGNLFVHFLLTLAIFAYKPLMEFKFGATVGKMAINAKVVSINYTQIGLGTAIIRCLPLSGTQVVSVLSILVVMLDNGVSTNLSYIELATLQAQVVPGFLNTAVSIFALVSVLVIAFSSTKQGLHDQMAKTYVVRK